jgi:hypothetical protein
MVEVSDAFQSLTLRFGPLFVEIMLMAIGWQPR